MQRTTFYEPYHVLQTRVLTWNPARKMFSQSGVLLQYVPVFRDDKDSAMLNICIPLMQPLGFTRPNVRNKQRSPPRGQQQVVALSQGRPLGKIYMLSI